MGLRGARLAALILADEHRLHGRVSRSEPRHLDTGVQDSAKLGKRQ
jgi:hypothetical protein